MSNEKIACTFVDMFEKIWDACIIIEEAGGCDSCPLKNVACLTDSPISMLADFGSKATIAEFLDFAEDAKELAEAREFDEFMEQQKGACYPWED